MGAPTTARMPADSPGFVAESPAGDSCGVNEPVRLVREERDDVADSPYDSTDSE